MTTDAVAPAALDSRYGSDDELKRGIQEETGVRPAEAFPDLDEDVRQSIARIEASPFVPLTDHVRGSVFDVATGRSTEVDPI